MKKLKRGLEFLKAVINNPVLAGAVLHDNRYWRDRFERRFKHSDILQMLPLTTFLPSKTTLQRYTFLGGGSMITDLLLLQHLAQRANVETYFEIGTWRGESMQAVLPNIRHGYSLDLDDRTMNALGFPEHLKEQMSTLIEDKEKVTFFKGDSMKFDYDAVPEKCDLIFIDGKHTYEYVKHDTEQMFKHAYHENSIVVWHDYGFNPEYIRWEVYQGIMDSTPTELHRHLYHVSNTKCAILLKDETLRATKGQVPQNLDHVWQVEITKKERP